MLKKCLYLPRFIIQIWKIKENQFKNNKHESEFKPCLKSAQNRFQ